MIAGCMDIGTNTTLALLAEKRGDELVIVRDTLTHNRFGESLSEDGMISAEAIALNVDLIGEIVRDFRIAGAMHVAACATAAMRRARNRDEFVKAVRDVTAVDVRVISGSEEAAMTYTGALSGLDILPNEHVSAIDIGGGSTEIVEGLGGKPGRSCSLDTGAVYLTKTFFDDGVPSFARVAKLRQEAAARTAQLRETFGTARTKWVLIGGTPVSLSIMKMGLKKYEPVKIGGSSLSLADLDHYIDMFSRMHPDEIQALPGMPTGRGRYIFAGTLLLRELFNTLGIQDSTVSERGLRHGFWLATFGSKRVS